MSFARMDVVTMTAKRETLAARRRSSRGLHRLLLACVTACLLAHSVPAQDRAAAPRGVEPKADEVFTAMSARLAAAQQFSFESRSMIDRVLDSGLRVQYSRRSRVIAKRPDALAVTTVGDVEDSSYAFRDGKLSMLDRRTDTYAQVDVPKTIDEMLDHMAARYGLVVPLCDLLFSDPRRACLESVYTGVYVGLHDVDGVRCHHLAFRQEGVDWQIWIAETGDPLPRKVVITYKDLPDSPQFVALLGDWNLADEQPPTVFDFTAPPSAKRIELPALLNPADGETAKPEPKAGGE